MKAAWHGAATAALCIATAAATTPPTTEALEFGPSEASARQNAFAIFNALHSAMRQWGSSRHHNGLSFFLATVPKDTILYHGTWRPDPPPAPEWLAFQIEHAEQFARPMRHPPPGGNNSDTLSSLSQFMTARARARGRDQGWHAEAGVGEEAGAEKEDGDEDKSIGYLQLYRTTEPLRLLYIDGMSAGNTLQGTLDSQDLLIRGNRSAGIWDEFGRARELCKVVSSPEWGSLHGIVRMEAGFEIIKCGSFTPSDGVEMVASRRRDEDARFGGPSWLFDFVHSVSCLSPSVGSYGDGIRAQADFSSMVSALFYPIDLGNPDTSRPDLPRLVGATDEELRAIKKRVGDMLRERRRVWDAEEKATPTVDWQGIADLVVGRYAARLWAMAKGYETDTDEEALSRLRDQVNSAVMVHLHDYDMKKGLQTCGRHHTQQVHPVTPEDKLVLAAFEMVEGSICEVLFALRELVWDPDAGVAAVQEARRMVQELNNKLKWSRWSECSPGCGQGEVCFTPMWPLGDVDSFERPNCRNTSNMVDGWFDNLYWKPGWRRAINRTSIVQDQVPQSRAEPGDL